MAGSFFALHIEARADAREVAEDFVNRVRLTANIRRWAVLRLILGLVQISGAAFSVGLIVHSGVTPLAIAAVIVTGMFTGTSIWLFQVWKRGAQSNTLPRDRDR